MPVQLEVPTLGQEIPNLPSPPDVALKVIEVTRDPDKGASDLADVLQLDPALTAKILQVANSASYAFGREVVTVSDAVNLIGLRSLSIIALGFSLKTSMPAFENQGLTDTVLWQHSVATGVASRSISRFIGHKQSETAFLCGMLSRIGQLIFLAYLPDQYAPALSAAEDVLPTSEEERAILGTTHNEIGIQLLTQWQLPSSICDTVLHWDDADETSDLEFEVRQLVKIVKVGDAFRSLIFNEHKGAELERLHTVGSDELDISDTEIDQLFIACQTELEQALEIFTNKSDTDISCESILTLAKERLVQVSISMATDLTAIEQSFLSLKACNDELLRKSTMDVLTGLPNRAALNDAFRTLDQRETNGNADDQYSIIMIDVDKFKNFNDAYGHQAGDRVLRAVGEALSSCARSTDFIARYGGEEFTVILPRCGSLKAAAIAERFRSAISQQTIDVDDKTVSVTASAGVASSDCFPVGTAHTALLESADAALYQAKKEGRNRTVQHQPAGQDGTTVEAVQ